MQVKRKKRSFIVGKNKKIKITEKAIIKLGNNEQITFLNQNDEYDVVKKNWGYYCTPSINNRLKVNNFRSFIVSNKKKNIFFMIANKKKINMFKKYLKSEENKILIELTDGFEN